MIPSSPIAYRTLTWHGHGGTHDVTASIFAPTPVDDHFVCAVAIDGLPGPIRTNVTGIDSLQAIINAVVSVRGYLDTHADDLSFLDQPRQHGIPFIVPPLDADEERYIEQLVWSEIGHYLEISSAEHTRRASQLAEAYGLRAVGAFPQVKTEVLIEMLSEATDPVDGVDRDSTRAYVLEERRRAIKNELKKRGSKR